MICSGHIWFFIYEVRINWLKCGIDVTYRCYSWGLNSRTLIFLFLFF